MIVYFLVMNWERSKRGSNCLTGFSLCNNYDSFIPLSLIHFRIPYNLKSELQQTGEISCVIEFLFSLMYSIMVLIVVCWRYRMPLDANGCVSTLRNITFIARMFIERDKSVNECRFNKMNVCVQEFEVSVNDNVFSGNYQKKVYKSRVLCRPFWTTCKKSKQWGNCINVRGKIMTFRTKAPRRREIWKYDKNSLISFLTQNKSTGLKC